MTSDGRIGREIPDDNPAPTPVTYSAPSADLAPSSNPVDAPSLCAAGGLYIDVVGAVTDEYQYVSLSVPAGVTVSFDSFSTKAGGSSSGSWVYNVRAFEQSADGSVGNVVGSETDSTRFYWRNQIFPDSFEERYYNDEDRELFTSAEGGEYLIGVAITTRVRIDEADNGAAQVVENITFTDAGGSITSPCGLHELFKCQADGGNLLSTVSPASILDALSPGCYQYDHCGVSLFLGVFDMVGNWECFGDPLLDELGEFVSENGEVVVAAAVVAGMLVLFPASAGLILGGAALGAVTAFWSCDQSDNGWWRPSTDLDSTCVATEIALGAVFGPAAGALAGKLSSRLAVACIAGGAEGATGAAAHMAFVDEGEAFDFADVVVGGGLGCAAGGVLDAAFARFFRKADDVVPNRAVDTPCNSFPTGTLVLMADGTHRAIESIEPGDEVVAFDEDAGVWSGREVLDQWSHLDTGDIVTVTLDDGSLVSATDHHLFWEVSGGEWVEAEDLEPGDLLADPDGPVAVADVTLWPQGDNLVWELTVDVDHTFTVNTGTVDVVVHNAELCELPQEMIVSSTRRQHVLNGDGNGGWHHRPGGANPAGNTVTRVLQEFDSGSLAGVYQAVVEVCANGRCFTKVSTFFPDSWTASRVLDEISSAYRIALANGNVLVGPPGFVERSQTGMPIRIFINEVGELISAYPEIP